MKNNEAELATPGLTGFEIAVIGMSGKFPGSENIEAFWDNLKNGREGIVFFSDEELQEAGVSDQMLNNPQYVKAYGWLEEMICFDAEFFGYTPLEAEIMDPQVRLFHQCGYEALEDAGYDASRYKKRIGIYAGASASFDWQARVELSGRTKVFGWFAAKLLMDKDFLGTRLAYKLGLKGPAVTIDTACSTSLTAIHLACQGLIAGDCDMALAGGVTVPLFTPSGYLYQEGMIIASDSHCRAFDARADGSSLGNGAAIVVLKRYTDAAAAGDHVYALIKGSAVNNDGDRKGAYTAPSIDGQSVVIRTALAMAEVEPETVTYVETHGTGTTLGDPVEIEGLKAAFNTTKKGFCRIGSVKTNVGHLEMAAGVTGFIKTVLALKHKQIPPSLHFENPNPKIDLNNSPFVVNTQLTQWKPHEPGQPLRAGVSSFGIGGTNTHVVLEQAPISKSVNQCVSESVRKSLEGTGGLAPPPGEHGPAQDRAGDFSPYQSREYQLILLSAKTETALQQMNQNLDQHLQKHPDIQLADAAYTLQVGRQVYSHRGMLVRATNYRETPEPLSLKSGKMKTCKSQEDNRPIIFMFPGLGSQYVNMGREIYEQESIFREEMNRCIEIMEPLLDYDIKEILYPGDSGSKVSEVNSPDSNQFNRSNGSNRSYKSYKSHINQTEITQPVIFAFEYSLARLLMQWGIKPRAMIGYSLGEYTAACLSGVFSLEDAIKVIVTRGKLIGKLPPGAMLSVPLSKEDLKPLLTPGLSIAIDNGPSCIVAGPVNALEAIQNELKKQRCLCIQLPNSHAIHSSMMKPIVKEFETCLEKVSMKEPQIPYISNLTGDWIKSREATAPGYWAAHLTETVQYAEGIQRLMKEPNPLFVEIGPGRELSALLVRHKQQEGENQTGDRAVNLIKTAQDKIPGDYYFLNKLGQLWMYGVPIDWKEFYKGRQMYRIPLPHYPFEPKKYTIDIDSVKIGEAMTGDLKTGKKPDRADWFYTQQWLRSTPTTREDTPPTQTPWLLFIDESPLGNQLLKRLQTENHPVVTVKPGENFTGLKADEYVINPGNPGDYEMLFKRLSEAGNIPGNIAHMWCVTGTREPHPGPESLDRVLERGLYSLMFTAGAIAGANINRKIQLGVITANMQYVTGEEELYPEKAALLGPVKIIPIENPDISCRSIDIIDPGENREKIEFIIENLLEEFSLGFADQPVIALRGACRWQETFESVKLESHRTTSRQTRLKEKGVYLVTGGFGGMGFVLAQHLLDTLKARLILVDILTPPGGENLDKWLGSDERKKEIQEKKQIIKEWQNRGADIQVHDVDVSDYQGMKDVITQAESRYGQINGVIHTAGLMDYAGFIRGRTKEMTGELLEAKIKGTLVLDQLLDHHRLDFMVLFSSLGNVLYQVKFGQVGYNAGHEFLDVYAYYKQRQGRYTVTIDWNDWKEVGMAERAAQKHHTGRRGPGADRPGQQDTLSISPEEGIDLFRRIVENNINRVVVCHYDLHRLMDFISKPTRGRAPAGSLGKTGDKTAGAGLHERPDISTEYEPPSDELEEFIINICEQTLGINKIGINDDWFELGGDSLILTQVISRIREVYPLEISLNVFFENPTTVRLAEMIKELLVEKVQGLSEEELDALVEQGE